MKRSLVFYLLALPAVIGFAFYSVIPAAMGVSYSFTRYDGFNPAEYIGFKNFIDLFNDSGIYEAYAFTFRYAIVGTLLVNVVSLAVAIGLNANIRFKTYLRGVFFIPNVLKPAHHRVYLRSYLRQGRSWPYSTRSSRSRAAVRETRRNRSSS